MLNACIYWTIATILKATSSIRQAEIKHSHVKHMVTHFEWKRARKSADRKLRNFTTNTYVCIIYYFHSFFSHTVYSNEKRQLFIVRQWHWIHSGTMEKRIQPTLRLNEPEESSLHTNLFLNDRHGMRSHAKMVTCDRKSSNWNEKK